MNSLTLRRINQSINRLVSKAGVLTAFVVHFHAKGLWDIEITRNCKHMALAGSVPPSEWSKWPIFSHCEGYLITVPCESGSSPIDYLCAQQFLGFHDFYVYVCQRHFFPFQDKPFRQPQQVQDVKEPCRTRLDKRGLVCKGSKDEIHKLGDLIPKWKEKRRKLRGFIPLQFQIPE